MMKQKTTFNLTSDANDWTLGILASIINLILRLSVALPSSFPLNDGGLFYRMILDLQENHFALPAYTSYNNLQIPFAYPPLGFYFSGLISSAFHIDLLTLARLLPSVVNSLGILAFYFLARRVLGTKQEVALAAVLAFIFTPRGFEWQIMGGGLTRTFGVLFAILSMRAAYIFYHEHDMKQLIPIISFGTLTVLSHPEAPIHTAVAVAIFYLVLDRSRRGLFLSLTISIAILLLSAPWWAIVLAKHGIYPFLAVITAAREAAGVTLAGKIFLAFQFNFTEEPFLPLISILGLIGLFATLSRREPLLALWMVSSLFIEPRSAPQFMTIPLAMLAGIGLVEIVLPALAAFGKDYQRATQWSVRIVVFYLLIYELISTYVIDTYLIQATLKPDIVNAFTWVKDKTPADSRFAIVTNGIPLSDSIAEWFPALTGRTSLNTVFGTEWFGDKVFGQYVSRYTDLKACIAGDASCVETWAKKYDLTYTYILIRKQNNSLGLINALQGSDAYQIVYDSNEAVIFEKTK